MTQLVVIIVVFLLVVIWGISDRFWWKPFGRYKGPDGQERWYREVYRNPYLSRRFRNGPLFRIPAGLLFLTIPLAFIMYESGGLWRFAGLGLSVLWPVGVVAILVMMRHPPEWVKPKWLRDLERQEREGLFATDKLGRVGHPITITRREYRRQQIAIVVLSLVLGWLLGWPYALMGLAAAVSCDLGCFVALVLGR